MSVVYTEQVGCGELMCISITNPYFCSRTCRKNAIKKRQIDCHRDINYQESNLLLTLEAHERLFSSNQSTFLKVKLSQPDAKIGCGDGACVNIHNRYFCSRSCKEAAERDNLIDDMKDIDYDESNLLLTIEKHTELKNTHPNLFI